VQIIDGGGKRNTADSKKGRGESSFVNGGTQRDERALIANLYSWGGSKEETLPARLLGGGKGILLSGEERPRGGGQLLA